MAQGGRTGREVEEEEETEAAKEKGRKRGKEWSLLSHFAGEVSRGRREGKIYISGRRKTKEEEEE